MTPCGSYKNRRFGGSYRLHFQGAWVRAGYRAKLLALVSAQTLEHTRRHLPEDDNHAIWITAIDWGSQNGSVSIITTLRSGRQENRGSVFSNSLAFFSPQYLGGLLGPASYRLSTFEFSPVVNRLGRGTDHLSLSSFEVKMFEPMLPLLHMSSCLGT
jgi:hypothetical protein